MILGALRNDSVEGASTIDVGWKQKRAVAVTLVTSAAASFATVGLLTLGSVRYVLVSILGVPANVKFLVLPFVLVGSFVLLLAALVGDFKVCGAFLRSSSGRAAAFERVSHKGLVTGAEGSRYVFAKAKATPRVDVAETPVFGTEYEHEGKSVKEPSVPEVFPVFVRSLLGPHLVFLVSDCTPVSSLVLDVLARTGVPEHLFGLVVEGKVVAEELILSECGVRNDMTLCMTARLRGGSNPTQQRGAPLGGAGQWFCVACQLGGCYAIRTRCFWCGLSRQESERATGSSAPSSWPLPPGPVQNRRQPRIVPPREVSYPASHFPASAE